MNALLVSALLLASTASQASSLTLEERIAAQEAIEGVFWSHRTWPADNPGTKQPLSKVLPKEALRARVEDALRQSAALKSIWNREISHAQLQVEMNRMAAHSRAPQTLRELFLALHDDPNLIAETLVRPVLAERRIRTAYARDLRFHADVRAKAEAALASVPVGIPASLEPSGADVRTEQWKAADMDAGAWTALRGKLGGEIGVALPVRQRSTLLEDDTRFYVVELLDAADDAMTVVTASWPKTPFDAWWKGQREHLPIEVFASHEPYVLPALGLTDCTPDTWEPTFSDVPGPGYGHTAVWTGAEMVVWGGTGDVAARYAPATDTWTAMSRTGAPPTGVEHTAVWTGSEMVVWGGTGVFGSPRFDRGGRYDPVLDRWRPTSLGPNVPSPRNGHTAVWTGSRMLIWGGEDSSYLPRNDGGSYDPVGDRWMQVSTGAAVPSARMRHSAIWTGTRMIVWGGFVWNGAEDRSGGRYDPLSNTWTPTAVGAATPSARWEHSAVWSGTEMIVWGGQAMTGSQLGTGARYDPVSDGWTPTAVLDGPSARGGHTALWTGDRMVVWGGTSNGEFANSGGRYDPATDSWTTTSTGPGAPSGRNQFAAVWSGTEMIVWGGHDGNASVRTGGRYDPVADVWHPMATSSSVPSGRIWHTGVWTGTEMIVWGGYDGVSLDDGGRYIPALDSWVPTSRGAGVPSARDRHTAVWTGTEMIVWGGVGAGIPLATGGRYDPIADAWTATSVGTNVPSARFGHVGVWTGTRMVVWGGGTTHNAPAFTGGRYDPATDSWSPTSTAPGVADARLGATAVWTGTEVIVWGGYVGPLRANTGGRYDPVADHWVPTSVGANVPSPRREHTAVWTGSEMIVWGGDSSFPYTGGRYSPSIDAWTPITTFQSVYTWEGVGAVWSGEEMFVWGGGGYPLTTGGRYRPAQDAWSAMWGGAGAPAPRAYHTLAWTGSDMLLWGGQGTTELPSVGYRYCPGLSAPSDDSAGPTLTALSLEPAEADITVDPAEVTIHLDAADSGSGVSHVFCTLQQVSSTPYRGELTLTTGSEASGTWAGPVTLPQRIPTGAYQLSVTLYDGVNNMRTYGPGELAVAGLPYQVQVISHAGVRWVDCDDGDDANDGLSPETPLRSLNVALDGMTARDEFGGSTATELHILAGTCPSEGGIRLWPRTEVYGAGKNETVVKDHFLLSDRDYCYPCDMRQTIRDLTFEGVEMGDYEPDAPTLTLLSVRATGAISIYSDAYSGLHVEDSILHSVETAPGSSIFARRTQFLGLSTFYGFEDSGVDIDGCTFFRLVLTDKIDGRIRRSAFRGWGPVALVYSAGNYRGGPIVTDSVFGRGYDKHARVYCSPSIDEVGCGIRFERNTFVGSAANSMTLQVNDVTTVALHDNAFAEIGGDAIVSSIEEGTSLDVTQNNFDSVDNALCVNGTCYATGAAITGSGFGNANMDFPSDFVGPTDYHLRASSALVDAGNVGSTVLDLDGYPRPVDGDGDGLAFYDIGAYEFTDSDRDRVDDRTDNCLFVFNNDQANGDGDALGNACDNCPATANASQSDLDADQEGDACDLDDGLIYVFNDGDPGRLSWQNEQGFTSWNVYAGDLAVLRGSGTYTQAPGSNPLAERHCGLAVPYADDSGNPPTRKVSFHLVTGISGGSEGTLGTDSSGTTRPNVNPCP